MTVLPKLIDLRESEGEFGLRRWISKAKRQILIQKLTANISAYWKILVTSLRSSLDSTYIFSIPHARLGVNIILEDLLDLLLGLGDDDYGAAVPIPLGGVIALGLIVQDGAFKIEITVYKRGRPDKKRSTSPEKGGRKKGKLSIPPVLNCWDSMYGFKPAKC